MKRAFIFVLAVLALSSPVAAQNAPGVPSVLKWKPLWMRSTTAASAIARDANWAKGLPGSPINSAYTDSIVFRRGATTATVYDTSAAYDTRALGLGPG